MSDIAIDFQRARINMVESQVKPGGVRNMKIWDIMSQVPRELFVGKDHAAIAYMDKSVSQSFDRKLIAPLTFALLVELAEIQPNDLILDIACGTGYSTAVLSALGGGVVGVEQDSELADKGSQILLDLDVDNGVIVTGAHAEGQAKQGPYDVILINGFVPKVPASLLAQLNDKGRLVCVSEHNQTASGMVFTKINDSISVRAAFEMITEQVPGFEKEEAFSF